MKPTQKSIHVARVCDFPGCGRKHEAKGLCNGHYRQQLAGQELRPLRVAMSISQRLAANSQAEGSCRLWTGHRDSKGYGRIQWDGTTWLAHRAAYTLKHDVIPEDMQVNHICGVPACVELTHLELVTPRENTEYLTRLKSNNTSGYRGVYFFKDRGKYRASVMAGGTTHSLGLFATAEEAAKAAAEGRAQLHSMPEFSARVV